MTVTALAADETELPFDDDRAANFGNAVQMWAFCQERGVTVAEAALAFNATPAVIRRAVEDHPWMYLDGDRIEHDGE